ncbi:MAG: acetyl-CoA carboxylase biotin carboxyl carrier protein [Lachnoclostridium sp.]|nr:acetyl-CoA carboxylase biotin carboxyl carrier protein [Lachnoclostridium sp.]
MEIKDIIELMKAVSDNGLTKFELEQGDTKIVMKSEKKIVTVSGPAAMEGPMAAAQTHVPTAELSGNIISCPLVGTFYASPSPEAECFVKVGDHVKKGQVVGIVEAMKLMNEIESEYDGVVEEILVNNEDTVEYGQPLFVIR